MADNDNHGWTQVTHKKDHRPKDPTKKSTTHNAAVVDQTPWYEPPTIIVKKPEKKQTVKTQKLTGPNSARNSTTSHYQRKIEQIADSDEGRMATKSYPDELKQKLISLRTNRKWTQKELAFEFQIKDSVIRGIENGTEIYDPTIMQKISSHLQRLNN